MPVERSPKSRREIERLVLHELQMTYGCEGAAGISIVGWDNPPLAAAAVQLPNWTVEAFDSGTADGYSCERELMSIVSRLQGYYELVQKH